MPRPNRSLPQWKICCLREMTKSQKILAFGFLLVLGIMAYMEATAPQPVNWFPSYNKEDKIPLGTFVIHKLMADFFGENFHETNAPPFEVLQDSSFGGNYVFINNAIHLDKTELDSLLHWTGKGNNLFISANHFSQKLLDTFKLKMATAVSMENLGTEPALKLVNKNLSPQKVYHIKKDLPVRYFSQIDTATQKVLGLSGIYTKDSIISAPRVNFIYIPFSQGAVYLHSQPEAFSNYSLLSAENVDYVSHLLAYLNNGLPLVWDNYYKSGKRIDVSPLRVLLQNKHFKWAYYFVLIAILLFVIFEGKRKQRSIPIIKPVGNKTVEYTQTIAGMYLDKREYGLIAKKQISLFLEYIRTRLRVPTENINTRFYKEVAERSGNTHEDTVNLFNRIAALNTQSTIDREDLKSLYHGINAFKKKSVARQDNPS